MFWIGQAVLGQTTGPFTLVVHGGAGVINRENMPPEKEKQYREKLAEALSAGYDILVKGGTSLEAITQAIMILENSPLFNAGRGAVFTGEGKNELDASIMTGHDLEAGAVAGVTTVKNPILAAREVLQNSPHVMMAGLGAEEFAEKMGLELVENSYFFTQERYDQLIKVQEMDKSQGSISKSPKDKYGTVGAVALDQYGNIAAGTSTGGMTNKKYGRVGDSPIIAAGTYADNNSCGVSCTGHGEYFIRSVAAYDVAARIKYLGLSLEEAANQVIESIGKLGGSGGFVALDRNGEIAMPFNSSGMFRGFIREKDKPQVFIYR